MLYVAAYAVIRFLVEFVRGNEVVWEGLTRPQLFLALTIPLLAATHRRAASAGAATTRSCGAAAAPRRQVLPR